MNTFSEDNLIEQTAVKIFGELWGSKNFINAYSEEGDTLLGRDNQGQVVLVNRLKLSLEKLNKDAPQEAIAQAVEQLTQDRSTMSLVNANYETYKLAMRNEFLTAAKEAYQRITKINGVEMITMDDGTEKTEDQFINEFLERINKVYPKPDTLRAKFSMSYVPFQMELPDLTEATIDDVAEENEKRTLLTQAYEKKMRKSMEAYAEDLVKQNRDRSNEVITKIIDNLKNGKRFDVRTVEMIANMIKDFSTLNIVGDFNLENTLKWFKESYLDKYNAKQIKESDQIKADMLRDITGIQAMINNAEDIQALATSYRTKIKI